MSYILDALKKANAEREYGRGVAPGLYTQPVQGVSESPAQIDVALKKRNALLLALIVALLLCAATMGALFWSPVNVPKPPVALAQPSAQQTSATTPPIAVNVDQANSPPAKLPPLATTSVPAAPVRVTPAPYNPAPPPLEASPPQPAKPEPAAAAPRPRAAPTHKAPSQLPASVRAALPPLVISGSTYSDNPAYRMLIINGQVYREGEFPTPELKLEQIRQKSALIHYKGNTYALPY